jgi:hypothetical protein
MIEHNVETNEIHEITISADELRFEINPEIIAMREANAVREAAKKAVFEKLGLTQEEIDLLL